MFATQFRPSQHGFAFPNTWHDMLLGALPVRGRCGGMAFAALDYFDAGQPVPKRRDLPAYDSQLARLIWRRQLESVLVGFGYNLWHFVALTYLPGQGRASRREAGRILDRLSVGRPVPLGLISALDLKHLGRNHQVLAYGAELLPGRLVVGIYDPNHPLRDDITLDIPLDGAGPVIERIGDRERRWRTMFAEMYTPIGGVATTTAVEKHAPDDRLMVGAGVVGFLLAVLAFRWLLGPRRRA